MFSPCNELQRFKILALNYIHWVLVVLFQREADSSLPCLGSHAWTFVRWLTYTILQSGVVPGVIELM